jgi:hypothetical protein
VRLGWGSQRGDPKFGKRRPLPKEDATHTPLGVCQWQKQLDFAASYCRKELTESSLPPQTGFSVIGSEERAVTRCQ